MDNEKEWLEVVSEINSILDHNKESAQKIIRYCNDAKNHHLIDVEFLEILNGLSKIGTLSSNADRINNYSQALSNAIETAQLDMRIGAYVVKHMLNQLCATGFNVEKKGKKMELKFPKININLQNFETP